MGVSQLKGEPVTNFSFKHVFVGLLMGLPLLTYSSPPTPPPSEARMEGTDPALDHQELGDLRKICFQAISDSRAVPKGKAKVEGMVDYARNPVLLAYVGSFRCLEARDALWPMQKWNWSNEGLAKLDAAVAKDPDSVEIRVLRCAITTHLPFFFSRADQAKKDQRWLKERMSEAQTAEKLDPELKKFTENFLKSISR